MRRQLPQPWRKGEIVTPIPEPTPAQLAANFAGSLAAWAKTGFKITSHETYSARATVCDSCPQWDASARFGLGKCLACGCTRFKRWLATEKCPLDKWPA